MGTTVAGYDQYHLEMLVYFCVVVPELYVKYNFFDLLSNKKIFTLDLEKISFVCHVMLLRYYCRHLLQFLSVLGK